MIPRWRIDAYEPPRTVRGEGDRPRATFRDDLAESWHSGLIVVGGLFLALIVCGLLDVTHWLGGLLLAASQGGVR